MKVYKCHKCGKILKSKIMTKYTKIKITNFMSKLSYNEKGEFTDILTDILSFDEYLELCRFVGGN